MLYGIPWPTCALAAGLCGASGVLPDLDSGSSVIARESAAFASAIAPVLLLERLQRLGISYELTLLLGVFIYLLVRFSLAVLLRRFTHRGILHSLLAAAIFSGIVFLLPGENFFVRFFRSGAVIIGYISHLVLDELWGVEYHRFRLKRSFGSAFKLFRRND